LAAPISKYIDARAILDSRCAKALEQVSSHIKRPRTPAHSGRRAYFFVASTSIFGDPECKGYSKALKMIPDGVSSNQNVLAKVTALIEKAEAAQTRPATKSDDEFGDKEGEVEKPEAKLTVTFNKTLGRFIIEVEGNVIGETLTIRANKKGGKSLRFTLGTDGDGVGGFRTATKLSGYTPVSSFDLAKLDSARVC
jgi:hypothetical protein